MIRLSPPVRFIATIVTLWVGLRIVFWAPAEIPPLLLEQPGPFLPGLPALPLSEVAGPPGSADGPRRDAGIVPVGQIAPETVANRFRTDRVAAAPPSSPGHCGARCQRIFLAAHMPPLSQPLLMRFARRASRLPVTPLADPAASSRFSLAAWVQWRSGDGVDALADDGELGGSQAGVRARYRIVRAAGVEAALAARLSRPIERDTGAEAAIGIAFRPAANVPVELTAERWIALDDGGRDAWALGIAGGIYRRPLPFGLELDGYAQAGIVGARSRDLYGDAALIVSRPVPLTERSTLSLGGGVWAGAQPGLSRVDIGPEAGVRLPVGNGGVRLSLSWRERVAGSARPGSGPVLTLGADF
ncbi:hypothetical protein HFP57_12580 [Parasphingopyxis algicola]|uniref:hypothetical protein n=1 Tax=Parasphingopyxis algicola TaxID=2026624 RepID=UPI0015A4CB4A|nr:hypothetical protein [Parasphingopyxis algicola]QLC25769.1 hypothetical protein HFP57_12580 [Parasphingopyxis algicola]